VGAPGAGGQQLHVWQAGGVLCLMGCVECMVGMLADFACLFCARGRLAAADISLHYTLPSALLA
jgi:hypothetical protein